MPSSHYQRLRQATREAQGRADQARREGASEGERAPRLGDLFAFAVTAEHSVLWVVLEVDSGERYLLVAADLDPAVGSSDFAIPAESACGSLSLRCGFEVWLDAKDFAAAEHSGALAPEILEKARRKWAQVVSGNLIGSSLERETDTDPEYQDWLEEGPARAQADLLASLSQRSEEADAVIGNKIPMNGVDGVHGRILMDTFDEFQAAAWAEREPVDPSLLQLLQHVHRVSSQPHLGLPGGADPGDVTQVGWAVVFHGEESAATQEALRPLIEHRREQVGAAKTKILEYRAGEGWREWLSRHGVAAGQVEPAKVPYYLLLVGSPTKIPYAFELALGIEYAVGRVSFAEPEDLRRYAESVIDSETSPSAPQSKTVVFFAPRHSFDPATQCTADLLVKPLMERPRGSFATHRLWGADATRGNLEEVFHGTGDAKPPALFFAAAQGLAWPPGHPRQRREQGALLCQDWTTPGQLDPDRHCFGPTSLADEARVKGTIAFLYASHSAGTQEIESFTLTGEAQPLAAQPFVGGLAKRLLAHPRGGALAVIGLAERAWGASTEVFGGESWKQSFQDMLEGLEGGLSVGQAVKGLKQRYAALEIQLVRLNQKKARGATLAAHEVAAVWSARNEMRGVVIVGDPVVRLRIEVMD